MPMALDEKVKLYLVVKDGALTDLAGNISTWDVNTVQIANSGGPYNNACLHFANNTVTEDDGTRLADADSLLHSTSFTPLNLNAEKWTLSFWYKPPSYSVSEWPPVEDTEVLRLEDASNQNAENSLRITFQPYKFLDYNPETGEQVWDQTTSILWIKFSFIVNDLRNSAILNLEIPSSSTVNTWMHIAIVKNTNDNLPTIYVNGVHKSYTSGGSNTLHYENSMSGLRIQEVPQNGDYNDKFYRDFDWFHYNDYMDEICFVEDALWTSDFTPPTEYLYESPPTVYKRWPKAIWEQFCQEFAIFFSMAVSNTVLVDGVEIDSLDHVSHFGVCSTAASTAAKTVAISQFNLVSGAKVVVKFENTNTASNPTLNVNSTGAVSIKYKGSDISSDLLAAGSVIEFVYDGTYYQVIGISEQGSSSGLDTYTTGTSYTSGTPVIKDNAIYQANTNTSSTWVDSEWTKMDLVTNTNSTYLQKILTNITAPYELLLSVGNTNYCKAPINVLKKTGGSNNTSLTLETYNNPSVYTVSNDFVEIYDGSVKLNNYKNYSFNTQTLSTIDIGISDEIDFDDFYSNNQQPDSNTKLLLQFNNSIEDVSGNVPSTSFSTAGTLTYDVGKFGSCLGNNCSVRCNDSTNLYQFGSGDWTIDYWVYTSSSTTGSNIEFTGPDKTTAVNDYSLCVSIGFIRINGQTLRNSTDYQSLPEGFHHVAVVRYNDVIYEYIDGELIWSTSWTASVWMYSWLNIGFDAYGYTTYTTKVDEFRISNIARWTDEFTPPSMPYFYKTYNVTSLEVE